MISIPLGVPDDAMCIRFKADNNKSGDYFLWRRYVGRGAEKVQRWYWYSQGNQGEEDNAPDATSAARDWIRNGVASLKRPQD